MRLGCQMQDRIRAVLPENAIQHSAVRYISVFEPVARMLASCAQ